MMNKDNRNDKIRKIAKKGLTFSLCAVLAGGLAAGSFEGVNKLAGWSGATTVEAASNKDETTLTYAKSEKKDADASDSKSDTGKDTGSTAKGSLDVSEIVSEALPSIVSITTKSVQEVQNYFGMYGIQDGTFAKDFLLDMSDAGAQVHFKAMRKKASEHQSEKVGEEIRKLYSWNGEDKLINN